MEIPIKIGEATLSDLEEILAIEESNFSAEEAVSRQFLEECIRKSAGTFLVARDKNQLVGYILGSERLDSSSLRHGFIDIQSLSIHPDYQGQGLGTLLITALKEVSVVQGWPGIYLTCRDELTSYYEMNGFIDEGLDFTHCSTAKFNLVWDNPFYQE